MNPSPSDSTANHNAPAAALSSSRPRGKLARLFVGAQGIRAGWRALLFVALFAGASTGLGMLARHMLPPPAHRNLVPLAELLAMEIVSVVSALFATAVLAAVEHRSPFAYGLTDRKGAPRFAAGAVCGLASISLIVFVLVQAGWLSLSGTGAHGWPAWRSALLWGLTFLLTGIFEETLFRGYLLSTLTRGIGFWWSAALLSCLFGALHGTSPGETPVGLVAAVLIGLVLCLTIRLTGSLWWAIGFHAAWDWGESALYGTPDSGRLFENALFASHPLGNPLLSGGATGPEGSLLVLPLLAVMTIAAWAAWGRRTQR